MRLRLTPTTAVATHSMSAVSAADMRLHGRWLVAARTTWLIVAAISLGLVFASIPAQIAFAQTVCTTVECGTSQLGPAGARALHAAGLSLGFYAAYVVTLDVVFASVFALVGALLFWRRSDDRMALLASIALVTFGASAFTGALDPLSLEHPGWRLPVAAVNYLGSATFILFLYVFPDARFVPRPMRWVALAVMVQQALHYFFPFSAFDVRAWPVALQLIVPIAILGTILSAQGYRYRRVSSMAQREQTKWVVLGIISGLGGYLVVLTALNIAVRATAAPAAMILTLVGTTVAYACILLIPVSIAIAVLRSHLFDVDVLIERTLVYGALTASVILLYVAIVGALSVAFQVRANALISLAATGVIAVAFQPLRERLQRAVNRLIYGQRDEPYAVISRLGRRLEATLAPDAVLAVLVETVAQALKLPYVALVLRRDDADGEVPIAAWGAPSGTLLRLPMVYAAEVVGELVLATRDPGTPFSPADLRLLHDLARQAGVAVHATRLTAELRQTNQELRLSRTRLITAREEERRRLRRDLHDGLGSALTSMTFQLAAAQNQLGRDPAAVEALLGELKTQTQTAIADIRRLVYDLRPPALDELGLVSALREYVSHYQLDGLRVTLDAPDTLAPLPAAVELAAYRIALEALANVTRHAEARTCAIHLSRDGEALVVEVDDDGKGLAPEQRAGVGITAMRERAVELGGTCAVEPRSPGGVRVRAILPLGQIGE
ncbi:MAG TPA: GAF domain-containing sensor histidine kinase [Ktedonobacterales bacterium]